MSDNNNQPLTDEQTFFLALREHMKDLLAASMKNGKLITPEELHEQLTQYGKEHSKSKDEVMTWLQQANRDLVHEYISKNTQVTTSDDLPISLSNEGTPYNIAQDYIINSVLLQKFPPTNTVEETFDPKHHITPEELLDILEKEGLNDTVGKALFANDNKGKDFIVSDVHGGTDLDPAIQAALGQHMNNTMRIPDSKYSAEIHEEKPQDSAGINTNITAFHDANEDAIPDSKDEPDYKKKLRELLLNDNYTFKYDSEEDAKPWYLSPELMKIDPFSMGNLTPSETALEYAIRNGHTEVADYIRNLQEPSNIFVDKSGSMKDTQDKFDSSSIKNSKGGTDLGAALDTLKETFKNGSQVQENSNNVNERFNTLIKQMDTGLPKDMKGPSIVSGSAGVGRDFSKEAVKKNIQETSGKMGNDNNPDKPKNNM